MKRSYKKALDGVRQSSPLLTFIEQGMSPAEIKEGIIDLLSPHFTNQKNLEEMAVSVLVPEAVSLFRIEDDAWERAMFTRVLGEYQQALALDKNACLEGCASWESKVHHGVSEHWSGFYLEVDKKELLLEEFRYEAFRNIGMIVEACLQPLLKELLLQVRLRRGKANPSNGLETLDLGLAVGELHHTSGYPELFAPPPWAISLSQWRNMAQHHKTRVENGLIVGTYGRGSNEREVKLDRDELFDALKRIYSVFLVIKTARAIFLVDNIDEYRPHIQDIDMRADINVLHLSASLATQGFDVIDISVEGDSVTAVIKDMTDAHAKQRILHSSQFVYPVWLHFPADKITVEFRDSSGEIMLTTIAKGSDCKAVNENIIPSDELANRVELILSEKGKAFFAESSA